MAPDRTPELIGSRSLPSSTAKYFEPEKTLGHHWCEQSPVQGQQSGLGGGSLSVGSETPLELLDVSPKDRHGGHRAEQEP